LKVNDEIEIRPGVKIGEKWVPLKTKAVEIIQSEKMGEAKPGGLVALQTELDPSITKSDSLSGNIAGLESKLPPVHEELKIKIELFDHIIGVSGHQKVEGIKQNDVLMLTVAIAKTVGVILSVSKGVAQMKLKLPVCASKGDKVAISKQISGRWHLVGWGNIV